MTTINLPSAYCDNVYGLCGAYRPNENFANTLTVNNFEAKGGPTVWDGDFVERWVNGLYCTRCTHCTH